MCLLGLNGAQQPAPVPPSCYANKCALCWQAADCADCPNSARNVIGHQATKHNRERQPAREQANQLGHNFVGAPTLTAIFARLLLSGQGPKQCIRVAQV